ncbi:hypothetical protein GHT06_016388 [Daphnia sinensis]|uniref:Fibronectin type-III domain-containing protein n=1 Tax=Daphnia sinensis TaxID=1820382 RepID=A0AAD5L6G7_9CRUS|nr:hypothetical protein GHT06_016388 [Daphnia sinensis]
MTSTKTTGRDVTKMVVLGGHFEMGDFYDYRNDRIITGRKCWDWKEITGATWSDNRFTLKLKSPESGSTSNKWENMGLEEHSQASIMAGLIENHRGAAKYLNDREGLTEASQVLICRAKSRKLKLDLKTLISQDVPNLQDFRQEANSERNPTHVVVGVTYGAEVYCVLALESDENARKGAEEFLSKVARKMEEGLDNYLDLSDFKDQFDKEDKTQLTRVKCRLYSDFQSSAFRECGVFEAYKQCFKLIQQVQNTDDGTNEFIPIAILLCPLKTIIGQVDGKHFEYHDVDPELVARCGLIWNELHRICSKSAAFRACNEKADNVSFLQFEEAIAKYKELVQKNLKNGITKARENGQQDEIERVISIAENHPIFKPSRLEQWLQYQQAETEMYEKISGMTNIVCLSNKNQLEMELKNSFDAKYTLVLSVPVLDERMIGILEATKNYIISKSMYIKEETNADTNRSSEADSEHNVVLSHGIQRKQKYVFAKIREFSEHVEKNKHLENTVQFFIVFRQSAVEFACRYSVYETGRLLRDNLSQLPEPPTGLRIHSPKTRPGKKRASTYAIDLEWDYEDLGFPCHFLVEYRLDGNKEEVWTQRRTAKSGETQLAIPYTSGSAMTIRVAADTCIGRSEFSEVVDTVTIRELNEDEDTIPVPGFSDSEVETSATANNEEERDRTRKTEHAATSMLTIQQPTKTKNTETILRSTSQMDTFDMSRKGSKESDSKGTTKNEETWPRKDQDNEIGDYMTDESDEDDCNEACLEDDDGNNGEMSHAEEKTRNNAIEQRVMEMVVLESGFQVGDLYDYRNDRILTAEGRKSSKIGSAMKENNNFSLKFECSDSSSMSNKMENMGLDEHFLASFMAGLIEKPRGASKYLSSCCSSSQAAHVLICRAKSKVVRLDLQHLAIQDVKLLHDTWTKTKSPKTKANPTHIVVGVTYGAEAYCVLTQDLKDAETDDDSREEAEQFLSKIARKIEDALEEKLDLAEFRQQFEMKEKKQLSNIKCYLYTDFPTSGTQECSVPDAYKHYLKFVQQVQKTGIGNNKSIPIAVSLCPLQAIIGQTEDKQFEYHDVDPELFNRCARIWEKLDQVCAKSLAIRTVNKKVDKTSLRQFEEALGKYKSSMRTSLKNGITKARDTGQQRDIEKVAKITENHAIFKPSQLEQWLLHKQAECEMLEKISKMAKNVRLASKKQVEKELGEAFETKYTLILSLPSLDKRTNGILQAMKNCTETYDRLVAYDDDDNETNDDEEEGNNMPWNQQKQKYVLSKVREFAEHVEKNKHLENQVQFFMTFCDNDKDVGCRFSVYDASGLLKDNISQLPEAPTGLRFHFAKTTNPKKSNIALAWDYADLGFPCTFLVEYRPCDDESWRQKKTIKPGETQITIPYKTGSEIEFRVAADTCIGRSGFSEVINIESVWDADDDGETNSDSVSMYSAAGTAELRQRSEMRKTGTAASLQTSQSSAKNVRTTLTRPTGVEVEMVTQSTAELGWESSATEKKSVSYRVRYWQYGQDESQAYQLEVAIGESGCRLEGLRPETTYCVNIVAVSNGGREMSDPSETVKLTTANQQVRFAETIVKRCKQIGDRNGMNFHAVPLAKSPRSNSTVERFVFGKESSGTGKVQHRTVLVMGATGAGKTTLINGMINYIFNVEWQDTFRFHLIHEKLVDNSQSQSQTSGITAYDIYHAEGFRVPYSLTIVDTPGYGDTKGLDRDKEITEMIRKFFEDKSGIQNLDIIGFVAQASLPRLTPTQIYIFDSVLSIFGNDVKENIDFLLTFADGQNPPILSAIAEAELPYPKEPETGLPRHHKFNNSGFFCSNRESGSDASNTAEKFNRFFWRMGMENFDRFFSALATMKTKSLSLTKQVLEERKRLEVTVDGLQPLIKIGLSKMEEMRKTKQMISNCKAQIDANQNVEIEVEVNVPQKVANERGYLTNCNRCYVTCHPNCAYANDEDKVKCSAMNFRMPAETRCCTVCPEKCIWNIHANQPYRWEYVKQKQTSSSDAIKEKYETELNRKLTAEQLVQVLEKDIKQNDKIVLQHVDTVTQCIKRLDEIALRPNPFSTPQYIDLIIDAEQQEKRQGYKERIESLKKLRTMAVITSKIKNKENLMNLDRKDDYEAQAGVDEEDDNETVRTYDDDDETAYAYDDDDTISLQSAQTDNSKLQKFTKFFSFRK